METIRQAFVYSNADVGIGHMPLLVNERQHGRVAH